MIKKKNLTREKKEIILIEIIVQLIFYDNNEDGLNWTEKDKDKNKEGNSNAYSDVTICDIDRNKNDNNSGRHNKGCLWIFGGNKF